MRSGRKRVFQFPPACNNGRLLRGSRWWVQTQVTPWCVTPAGSRIAAGEPGSPPEPGQCRREDGSPSPTPAELTGVLEGGAPDAGPGPASSSLCDLRRAARPPWALELKRGENRGLQGLVSVCRPLLHGQPWDPVSLDGSPDQSFLEPSTVKVEGAADARIGSRRDVQGKVSPGWRRAFRLRRSQEWL